MRACGIELDRRALHALERDPGELEPGLRGRHDALVAGIRDDEDEQLRELELAERGSRERDVPVVRRVEDAAEDPRRAYCHSSSSSPTSTRVPRLMPMRRSASSSSSAGGIVPTTR